ncbi:MAG: redoxin domain-containing protein [Anaerolineales bacterium]|nr:redoxin domain-containing protein [Anaerolineales bacterium]
MAEETLEDTDPRSANRNWWVILVWVFIFGLLALLAFGLVQANRGPMQVGLDAPDFVLNTFDGQRIDTSELRGQVILVNVWASWCVTCRDEARELEQAYQTFKDQGVVFLGVDWSDTETKALAYLDEFGITYPNGPDLGGRIHKAYRVTGVPESFVIGPDGSVSSIKIGPYSSLSEIHEAIERALGQ